MEKRQQNNLLINLLSPFCLPLFYFRCAIHPSFHGRMQLTLMLRHNSWCGFKITLSTLERVMKVNKNLKSKIFYVSPFVLLDHQTYHPHGSSSSATATGLYPQQFQANYNALHQHQHFMNSHSNMAHFYTPAAAAASTTTNQPLLHPHHHSMPGYTQQHYPRPQHVTTNHSPYMPHTQGAAYYATPQQYPHVPKQSYFCEPCDKEFNGYRQYQRHKEEHVKVSVFNF